MASLTSSPCVTNLPNDPYLRSASSNAAPRYVALCSRIGRSSSGSATIPVLTRSKRSFWYPVRWKSLDSR
jgi:hypothetical protein